MNDRVLRITLIILLLISAGFIFWIIAGPDSIGEKPLDEAAAIALIKTTYPGMNAYPADTLPPRSIRTERSDEGWYIAFIQEGSGRPIISATCYFVDNAKNIMSIRTYAPEIGEDALAEFSAKTCTPGACLMETCHGLDIECGSNPPGVCTAMYEVGDTCLHYAQCGVQNGSCQPVENTKFTRCKSCVQDCVARYKEDNQKLFECEGTC